MTIEDFQQLPDEIALDHELIDGQLVDVSGNVYAHSRLRDKLLTLAHGHVHTHRLGLVVAEQDFDFSGNACGPDLSFVSNSKMHLLNGTLRVQRCVPDLAIEIVSQNDKFELLMKKVQRYRKAGTKEVWVFSLEMREAYLFSDQQRAILDENQQFQTTLIPGFSIRIGDLFDRI